MKKFIITVVMLFIVMPAIHGDNEVTPATTTHTTFTNDYGSPVGLQFQGGDKDLFKVSISAGETKKIETPDNVDRVKAFYSGPGGATASSLHSPETSYGWLTITKGRTYRLTQNPGRRAGATPGIAFTQASQ